jgi:transcriptional regulator with XRE-family HTH domain
MPVFIDHDALLRLREQRGERREKVCVAVGCSYPMLAGLEKGTYNPSLRLLTALAEHYRVPIDSLLRTPAGAA